MKKVLSLVFLLAFVMMTAVAFAGEWAGQVVKSEDGKLWFKVGEKNIMISNPEKATGFEGQNVTVTGELNAAGDSVTVDSVQAQAA